MKEEFYDFREGCHVCADSSMEMENPKDAFQPILWLDIRIRIYHGVCIALYFHYVGTDRRSFANFIECELELLKRVFLPVINLFFLRLICEFDGKHVPVSRSFVFCSFLASISKEHRHRIKNGQGYILIFSRFEKFL